MRDITVVIVAEAKRLEEDTLYSAKSHFNVANLWERMHMVVGGLATIAAALAAVFTLSHDDALVVALAVLASVSTGIMTFLNPHHIASSHRKSGTEYNAIHNQARIFHSIDCQTGAPGDALGARLKELSRLRDDLSARSLSIPRWAFEQARRGIAQGEAEYKEDDLTKKP
jgi:hypothetical protein